MNRLSQREKVLSFLVGGAVLLLVNLFVLQYFFNTQAQFRRDAVKKQAQLKMMTGLMRDQALWQQRDNELRSRQPRVENENRAGTDLLLHVQDVAKKHTVLVEQPVIGNPTRNPEYTAVNVNIETKSTWKSLVEFLHALQGPDEFIVLESANLRIDTQDQTQMRGRFKISKWFAPK
jgi:hypothetical protein